MSYPLSHPLPVAGKGADSYRPFGFVLIPGSAWLDGHGVNVYSNGGNVYGYYQCVELVERLLRTLNWSPFIPGNANQMYNNASPASFDKHQNGSGYQPAPGDIIVWGGGYGGDGHVQVVNSNNGRSLTVVEQNGSPSGYDIDQISASGAIPDIPIAGQHPLYVEGILHAKADHIGEATPPAAPAPVSSAPVSPPGATPTPTTTLTPTTTPAAPAAPTTTTPSTTTPAPASGIAETAGEAVNTWSDYGDAGGVEGATIAAGQTVVISCRVQGAHVTDGNAWWYRVASPPWDSTYYVSADAFYNNGQTSGNFINGVLVDPNVPWCAGAAPPTFSETAGWATHTWSNYSNAGGLEGSTVSVSQTVQVTCRVQGFAVADGNTWWYEIASNPWNDTYFASADSFYNNGQTTGNPINGILVDPKVAVC